MEHRRVPGKLSVTVNCCEGYQGSSGIRHSRISSPLPHTTNTYTLWRILHGIKNISCALKYALTITCDAQLRAITELRDLLKRWADPSQLTTVPLGHKPKTEDRRNRRKDCIPPTPKTRIPLTPPPPRVPNPELDAQSPRGNFTGVAAPNPRVETSAPRVETYQPHQTAMPKPIARITCLHQSQPIPIPTEHIAQRTQPHTANLVYPDHTSGRWYLHKFLLDWAMPIIDEETGQYLEYIQLQKNPKYHKIWNALYSNKLGQLCQGVGKVTYGPRNQCVSKTDAFKFICDAKIPVDRWREITYTNVVCEVRPHKADPHRTRITINGNRICYPGDVGTPTGSLELIKLIINSVVSRRDAWFIIFDIKNFYLETPMGRS